MSAKQDTTRKKPINKKVAAVPKEFKQLIVDTKRYKNQTSSTKILEALRYKSAYL